MPDEGVVSTARVILLYFAVVAYAMVRLHLREWDAITAFRFAALPKGRNMGIPQAGNLRQTPRRLIFQSMLYLIALFIPPLATLLAGRWVSSVFLALVWAVSILFTGPFGHVAFVVIAWVLIAQSAAEKRHKQLLKAASAPRS